MNKSKLFNIALLSLSAVLFIAGAIIIIRQYVFIPDKYVAPPTVTITPAPTLDTVATAAPTPSPTPYVKKVPVRMYFVDREISCPIETVGVVTQTDKKGDTITDKDGNPTYAMGTIDSEKVAAWLTDSASPGEEGNAIINGHVRWKKVAGVFSILSDLTHGEEIVIEYADGSTMSFFVDTVDLITIDDVPDWVMAYDLDDVRMTLITCHGDWNSSAGTSNERVVVVCRPALDDASPTDVSPTDAE